MQYQLDTENAGYDEVLTGDSIEEVTQDVLNRYECDELPEGWSITPMVTASVLNITPDEEYPADRFWDALTDKFPEIAANLRSENAATITQDQWTAIRSLPGFQSGMPHAPEALIVTDEA